MNKWSFDKLFTRTTLNQSRIIMRVREFAHWWRIYSHRFMTLNCCIRMDYSLKIILTVVQRGMRWSKKCFDYNFTWQTDIYEVFPSDNRHSVILLHDPYISSAVWRFPPPRRMKPTKCHWAISTAVISTGRFPRGGKFDAALYNQHPKRTSSTKSPEKNADKTRNNTRMFPSCAQRNLGNVDLLICHVKHICLYMQTIYQLLQWCYRFGNCVSELRIGVFQFRFLQVSFQFYAWSLFCQVIVLFGLRHEVRRPSCKDIEVLICWQSIDIG